MNDITFRAINVNDPAYRKVFELRETILRVPLELSLYDEDLSGEVNDHILIAEHGDSVLACLILSPKQDNTVQLRQMAVAENHQRKHLGQQLVDFAEEYAWKKGYDSIVLHARIVAQGFYERMNYKQVSGTFKEVGIPHVVMEKTKP